MGTTFKREMAISHGEFMRIFNTAFSGYIVSQGPDFIVINVEDTEARIQLAPEESRKIAALEWVVTGVELDLRGLSGPASARFIASFDRTFQKGGG